MASIISLNGWEKFQHYRDRDPPWVKLYRDLLTSESWVLGTDISRLFQVASVLLAARYGNKIPFDWKLVRKVASLECTPEQFAQAVAHLRRYDYLEIHEVREVSNDVEQSASTLLAKCSSEREAEGEKRQRREDRRTTRAVAVEPEGFAEIRQEYPKRAGGQRWGDAQKFYQRRLTEGAKPEDILAGVRRYAMFAKATSIERTERVQQAATFLGDNRGYLEQWQPPPKQLSAVERVREKLNGNGNGRVVGEQFGGTSEPSLGTASRVLRRIPDP